VEHIDDVPIVGPLAAAQGGCSKARNNASPAGPQPRCLRANLGIHPGFPRHINVWEESTVARGQCGLTQGARRNGLTSDQ